MALEGRGGLDDTHSRGQNSPCDVVGRVELRDLDRVVRDFLAHVPDLGDSTANLLRSGQDQMQEQSHDKENHDVDGDRDPPELLNRLRS